MSQPRTKAGRRLLARLHGLGGDTRHVYGCRWEGAVLAIEQEATALDVERLARALERANIATGWMVDPNSDSNFMRLQRTRANQAAAIAAEYARLRGEDER